MLKISEEQLNEMKKFSSKKQVAKLVEHLMCTFPDSNFSTLDINGRVEEIIINVIDKGIDTIALLKRFLEISLVYGWSIYQMDEIQSVLSRTDIHGYNKILHVEQLFMDE